MRPGLCSHKHGLGFARNCEFSFRALCMYIYIYIHIHVIYIYIYIYIYNKLILMCMLCIHIHVVYHYIRITCIILLYDIRSCYITISYNSICVYMLQYVRVLRHSQGGKLTIRPLIFSLLRFADSNFLWNCLIPHNELSQEHVNKMWQHVCTPPNTITTCENLWPSCENPVCPDPVWEPVNMNHPTVRNTVSSHDFRFVTFQLEGLTFHIQIHTHPQQTFVIGKLMHARIQPPRVWRKS